MELQPKLSDSNDLSQEFLSFAYQHGALQFGSFVLNSGRVSPYFLNTGLFSSGETLSALSRFYAQVIMQNVTGEFMLYGHAYKGIPLAASTAMELHRSHNICTPFTFNRKEAKDHGDTGWTVGAVLQGQVVIVEDVITSGISIDRAVEIIREHDAEPVAVVISLDRMERSADSDISAVESVRRRHEIDVFSTAAVYDLIEFVRSKDELRNFESLIQGYLDQYVAS